MTKEQEYFWAQYHGLTRAEDLPLDYLKSDERVSCANGDCFLRSKCLFYQRYVNECKVFRFSVKDIKRDRDGWERPTWDANYPKKDYRSASFHMLPEQKGTTCKYFLKHDN